MRSHCVVRLTTHIFNGLLVNLGLTNEVRLMTMEDYNIMKGVNAIDTGLASSVGHHEGDAVYSKGMEGE